MDFVTVATITSQTLYITPRLSGQILKFGGQEYTAQAGKRMRVAGTGAVEVSSGWWDDLIILAGAWAGTEYDFLAKGDMWWMLDPSDPLKVIGVKVWNGYEWADYQIVADSVLVPSSVGTIVLADGVVTTPKLAASAVEADNVAAGAIKGQHLGVGVDETGQRVEIVGSGITLYDVNDSPAVSLTTASDQFISISQLGPDGDLVQKAAIDSEGVGAFESVFISDDVEVAGTHLAGDFGALTYNGQTIDTPMLERMPRGIVYRAGLGVDDGTRLIISPTTIQYLALGSGVVNLHPGRFYRIGFDQTFFANWTTTGTSNSLVLEAWIGEDAQELLSPNGFNARWPLLEGSWADTGVHLTPPSASTPFTGYSGELFVLIRVVNPSARSFRLYNIETEPAIYLEDLGPVIDATDGGTIKTRVSAGSPAPVNPQPKTIEVQASWSANYSSGGGRITSNGGLYNDYRMVQGGGISGGSNARAGLIGFPDLGLSGKTITGAWIYLKNRHTGLGSGATVKFSTSDRTSAPSSSPNANTGTDWTSSTKKGEGKWHPIPQIAPGTTYNLWAHLAAGDIRCIHIGGPNLNSTNGSDYAIFDGDYSANSATGSAIHPKIKVSYK